MNNMLHLDNKKIFLSFIILILTSLLFSGCADSENGSNPCNGFLSSIGLKTNQQQEAESEEIIQDLKKTSVTTIETFPAEQTPNAEKLTETPEPTPTIYKIELWVPPVFDMDQNTNAGKALETIIDQYTKENPNININVRVKAVSGDSSMINTLTSANHIAKDVLPSVAFVSRSDMEIAVQRNLLQPIDTSLFNDTSSWYDFAKQSASVDSVVYGIPVFGDGLVLTYKPSKIGPDLEDWHDILSRGMPIGFAPSSSTSMFGLFIYLSIGGKLTNDQGQPYLDQQKLVETLNFFLSGGQNGAFPPSIAQLVDQGQVWQRFNDGTMSMIISQFSSFRHYQSAEIAVRTLPLAEGITEYPLIDTLNLVIVEDDPVVQPEAVRFAEYLSDLDINDMLSVSAGYLPVRKGDHSAWKSDAQFGTIQTMCESSTLAPNNQIINKLVPLINNAVVQVIKNQMNPENAANEALSGLN